MIVEYAGVLAAVSILAVVLGGGYSGTLASVPVTHAVALQQVAVAAKAKKVAVPAAKTTYRKAPYGKASLKYLHAVGWIGGRSNLGACAFTSITQDTARTHAEREIRRDPKIVAGLRKRGISARIAAATLVKGVVSACP
ncbi:MAG: hypothetical protein R6W48_12295 [Gaiellaceae bacterium]